MERHQFEEIQRFRVRVAIYLAILSLVVIGLGSVGHPGWAGGVLIVAGPALLYTAVKSSRRIRQDRPMATEEKLKTFLLSAGCVVVAIPLAGLALMIALFAICMAQGGLNVR